MTSKETKKAFELAEEELNEKKVEQLKEVIKATLIKIREIDDKIKELQEERKILKLDIDDFKEGRLDRIEERQKKDKLAKKVSVVEVHKEIEKEVHHYYDYWYQPYIVKWVSPPSYSPPITSYSTSQCSSGGSSSFSINTSLVKNNVAGTYLIVDKAVHLR